MPSSKLLKERIESIQDTMKITNAMYLISSSKLRKARKNYQNVSPYFNRMRDTISRVVPHLPEEPVHPFFHDRTNEKSNPRRAYLVLTADKGMAGAFNQTSKTVRHAPLVYRVEEIAQLLAISNRAAYNLCNTTKDFKVIRLGTSIRVSKQSFDDWFAAV